jgi:hypothetical protein
MKDAYWESNAFHGPDEAFHVLVRSEKTRLSVRADVSLQVT